MKFKGPKDASGVSVGGQFFQAKKGVIEVPDNGDYIALLAPHGFVPVNDDEQAKTSGAKKDAGSGDGGDGGTGDSGSGDGSQDSGQAGGEGGDAGGAAQ